MKNNIEEQKIILLWRQALLFRHVFGLIFTFFYWSKWQTIIIMFRSVSTIKCIECNEMQWNHWLHEKLLLTSQANKKVWLNSAKQTHLRNTISPMNSYLKYQLKFTHFLTDIDFLHIISFRFISFKPFQYRMICDTIEK